MRLTRLPLLLGSTALVLAVTLAGCSSGGPDAPAAGSDRVSHAAADWGSCMRDKGVQVEDPSPEEFSKGVTSLPSGIDQATFDAASEKCAGTAEDRGVDDKHRATPENIAKWKKQGEAVNSCLAEHGITGMTEPNEVGSVDFSQVNQDTPAFKEWAPKCSKKYAPDTETMGL